MAVSGSVGQCLSRKFGRLFQKVNFDIQEKFAVLALEKIFLNKPLPSSPYASVCTKYSNLCQGW